MKTDISVIIPNYNGAKYLRESIDSALDQTGVRIEVIVVDDGSTDNSREILESYGDRIRIYYQENKGAPAARNLGWKIAEAEYIKFLDADDVLLPGVLKEQLDQMNDLPPNTIPYGQAVWTDEKLFPIKGYPVRPIEEGQDPVHHILTQNPLTAAPLHRKTLLEKVNGFDESLVKGQEFDLHLRLVLTGVSFMYIEKQVYKFRQGTHPSKISNISIARKHKKIYHSIQKQEILIKHYFQNSLPRTINKVVRDKYLTVGKACVLGNNIFASIKFFLQFIRMAIK